MRLVTPRAVIDINRLPDLDAIRVTPDGLFIGALVRHEAMERSPLVREHAPLIAAAMPHVGHAAIRARGTFGGSLALADPAAELPACASRSTRRSAPGSRGGPAGTSPPTDFFRGIYTTALGPGEIVTEILVPRAAPRAGAGASTSWRAVTATSRSRASPRARAVERGAVAEVRLVFFGVGTGRCAPRRAEAALAGRRADADGAGRGRPRARTATSIRPATSTARRRCAAIWPACSSRVSWTGSRRRGP